MVSEARPSRGGIVAYWIATLILAAECVGGGVMGALQLPPFLGIIRHLGYPDYFMTILGVWYVLGGLALVAPRRPLLKEWAYAGMVFNYTGAAASHLAVGDGPGALAAPIVFACLVGMSWALRPSTRRYAEPRASTASARRRTVAYWITTAFVAAESLVGGSWDVLRTPYVRSVLEHLGYPSYFLVILGVWKLLGGVAVLVPRSPRLKEWAYAGMFFSYTGAVASHVTAGDGIAAVAYPVVITAALIASWALRPPDRRDILRLHE